MTEADYNLMFALLGFAGIILYTLVLFLGYLKAIKRSREELEAEQNILILVNDIFEDLKNTIEKGEENMTEKKDKLVAEGMLTVDGQAAIYMPLVKPEIKNTLTLEQVVTRKPTDDNYAEVISLLADLARKTYSDFKFFVAKSDDETKDYNFLQVVSKYEDDPYAHKLIFSKGIEYGIDMAELSKRFAEYAEEGNVLPLGDNTVLLTNDGTGQSPTGVSPITNGLEGSEIAFIFGFIQDENYDEWHKNAFPQEDEE